MIDVSKNIVAAIEKAAAAAQAAKDSSAGPKKRDATLSECSGEGRSDEAQ